MYIYLYLIHIYHLHGIVVSGYNVRYYEKWKKPKAFGPTENTPKIGSQFF